MTEDRARVTQFAKPTQSSRFATRSRLRSLLQWPPLLVVLVLHAASPASATPEYTLPTLFDVTGVADDDALNIRAAPNANAAIIGALAPNARNVEVVATDATGQWARVNSGESSGWAALRFLGYQSEVWTENTLPPSLHCLGNEPFWSLRPSGNRLIFATPETPETVLRIDHVLTTGQFRDPRRAIAAQGQSQTLTAVMVPMACSDGMSDRVYGLDITMVLTGSDGPQMLTGCCSLAVR